MQSRLYKHAHKMFHLLYGVDELNKCIKYVCINNVIMLHALYGCLHVFSNLHCLVL